MALFPAELLGFALIAGADEVKTLAGRMIDTTRPEGSQDDPRAALEAALDWWREAGVDLAFADTAQTWLAPPETAGDATAAATRPAPVSVAPPVQTARDRALAPRPDGPQIGGAPDAWPQSLENFRLWWLSEPSLGDGLISRRLPPRGVAGAKIMVIVPQPMAGDDDALVSGAAGQFLEAILSACGIAEHDAYIASALPAPAAMPDWPDLSARGLRSVLAHHVALARPARVLAFGRSLAPVLGLAADAARAPFTISGIPALAVAELAELARSPSRRQRFWDNWLEWTS